jgi:ribosomal protein S27AE
MKNLLIITFCLALPFTIFAQNKKDLGKDPNALPVKSLPGQKDAEYRCMKCSYTNKEPVQCPIHKTDLLREGSYYCKKDEGIFSAKKGKCPKCHQPLMQVTKPK